MRNLRWLIVGLFAFLLPAAVASAQVGGGLPPPGTLSATLPEGVEIYRSLFISDTEHRLAQGQAGGAAEARQRARADCARTAPDCGEVLTFPIRNQCLVVATDTAPAPGRRSAFAGLALRGSGDDRTLAARVLQQCAASGAACAVQLDYCF